MITIFVVTLTTITLVSIDDRLRHWAMLPVTVSGVLIGVDAVSCLRRHLDIFDPQALLGLFGFHFFYLAPILHIVWDYWARYLEAPPDWPAALGAMSILNVVGLTIYRIVLHFPSKITPWRSKRHAIDLPALGVIGSSAILISLATFAFIIMKFGGVQGYLSTMADRTTVADSTRGLGWLFVMGEAFPMMIFGLVVIRWRQSLAAHPKLAYALLAAMVVLQTLATAARGSRSNIIWPALLGLIVLHLVAFRIPRRTLLVCLLIFGVFMYVGGLYKGAGSQILDVTKGQRGAQELGAETGRDIPTLMLTDLGRADIQALVLHRKQEQGVSPDSHGVTYFGNLSFLVPPQILPREARPADKVVVGTDLLYGPGSFKAGLRTTRIFGLAGEAVINFGYVGGIASFLVLGLAIRGARRFYLRAKLNQDLLPKLAAAAICVGVILFHGSDLDNVAWYALKQVLPMALVIVLALRHTSSYPSIAPLTRISPN
ncbi:hypothetical protein E1193_03610 [Micromonospora sp. KC606]|uniref:hypothetical protein n=1 Tax=Micromonospora sp. KC606 TaxID=2530379 RepID=UPI00104DF1E3|nr:hypothetical protein [Micromonospora sp. KC606]TDC85173.1 hypothetical protein E1193_03610 [Micromonospora sp. KC606]